MPVELNETLVIGISATALFDLSDADKVFKEKYQSDPDTAIDEYRAYMLDKENEELADGTGMPLIRSLLNLNTHEYEKEKGSFETGSFWIFSAFFSRQVIIEK